MSKTPAVRFEGFTEDWEPRKIGNIGEVVTGSTPSTHHPEYYSEDGIPWVTPTDIIKNVTSDTPKKLSHLGAQVGRVVPAETILVTCIASIGKNTMLAKTGSFNQQINGLVPDKQKYNPYFLLTESYHWSEKMKREAAAGTMQIVNKNDFSAIETFVPELLEQQFIGYYFQQLDNFIALHQSKYEKLVNIKKSMLYKMFPQNGRKVPEMRFKGFTDDWEQRKFGDVLQTVPFKLFIKTPEQDGKYEIIQQGNEPVIGYANGTPCTDFEDTVIFGDHTLSLYKPNKPFFVATDGVRIVKGKQNLNGFYLLALLEKYRPKSEGYKRYYSILTDCNCYITENETEQKKIGEYFRHIDNLITLHQRKLEKLKQIKQALLHKMFV